MTISRRRFLRSATAVSLGFAGLRCTEYRTGSRSSDAGRFGPVRPDREGLLSLPDGFSYRVFSRHGERMDDGFLVPALHDGMATFPGPDGRTILVRNHEVNPGSDPGMGAFGADLSLLDRLEPGLLYDAGTGTGPALGGTTNFLFDTRTQTLETHVLSLGGTLRNCAGGPTPWGSWLTCEEVEVRAGGWFARDHGYVFEVPAVFDGLPTRAVALTAMGRFNHEAVAVHPEHGIVYLTEDSTEGLFYRFLPDVPGELRRGGRLQALRVPESPSFDTRNFDGRVVEPGAPIPVDWIGVEDVEAREADLRDRGFEDGAARFARGEGIWYGDGEAYFACTNGGEARKGQIWRYRPSPYEGTPREREEPATLELFVEPNDGAIVENADNLCVSAWGDLVVCEDGTGTDRILGVTPEGSVYEIGRNEASRGEFAGACFSPDGTTLFVNMQAEGLTVAITGPWPSAPDGG